MLWIQLEFQQGLDYLRSFQPDSEELFAKKLRFSPGDDAAKLPTAIANFGEANASCFLKYFSNSHCFQLTVSLPQFANRYLPLEQQYLPRPFRMSMESEHFMRRDREQQQHRVGRGDNDDAGGPESAGAQRWRRRRELEEEVRQNPMFQSNFHLFRLGPVCARMAAFAWMRLAHGQRQHRVGQLPALFRPSHCQLNRQVVRDRRQNRQHP